MSYIKRIASFDRQDWKHITWLTKSFFTSLFLKYDWHDAKEALIFIKIHLYYDSTRVEDNK